ncbi:phage baseplate assembly protein V [Sphingobium sp. WCS2017Hpa-17]|uniref:phage baseplate assembly protein V n=1 Tax=Sphingobium sp. WCS2017Hpa-17 TaxID=3073638 RepID=UPI00288A9683|nr:phage baseplate assembly protein V [Sphingobium sp. WCS2017Hpa-17]
MVATMAQNPDTERLTGEVLRFGTIASVDLANATCTVESGDIITGDLPWIAQRAGAVITWSPPTVGEQCLLLAPEGDIACGLVIVGLYSDTCPPPSSSADITLLKFPDGAILSYDHAAHALSAKLPAGGTVAITADGGVTIDGPLQVNGKVTATEDVVAAGISLKDHRHGQVQAGTAQSGKPI